MPQIKRVEVKSLFECCAEYVVDNMSHWCKKSDELIQTIDPEKSNNPFDVLPTTVLEQIIVTLTWQMKTEGYESYSRKHKHHLQNLMTPQLSTLDLTMLSELPELSSCISVASVRCPQLKCLKVFLPSHCEVVFVHLCALKFEKLQILDISRTAAGDHCLQIIGSNCQNLKELDVGYCENVTDAGMKGLCASVDHLDKEGKKLGPCQTIEYLIIRGTKITKAGVQLALQNLRSLKSLKGSDDVLCLQDEMHKQVVQVLTKMHQQDFLNSMLHAVPKYSLIDLELDLMCSRNNYLSGSLGLAASLCPLVTEVSITLCEEENFTDEDLLGLLHLKNIHRLSVSANWKITFDGGLSPLIRAFGRSLVYLEIEHFTDVNVGTIIKDCPNLRELNLEENDNYSMGFLDEEIKSFHHKRMKMELPILKNLEKLHHSCIEFVPRTKIGTEILVSLFSSPLLREIDIETCPSLTDDVFQNAFQLHQFKYLQRLILDDCDSVTQRGIDVLMNDCNPLILIFVYSCNLLTKKNVQDWEKKISEENWNCKFYMHSE